MGATHNSLEVCGVCLSIHISVHLLLLVVDLDLDDDDDFFLCCLINEVVDEDECLDDCCLADLFLLDVLKEC